MKKIGTIVGVIVGAAIVLVTIGVVTKRKMIPVIQDEEAEMDF